MVQLQALHRGAVAPGRRVARTNSQGLPPLPFVSEYLRLTRERIAMRATDLGQGLVRCRPASACHNRSARDRPARPLPMSNPG
jgi:hypothetical protein